MSAKKKAVKKAPAKPRADATLVLVWSRAEKSTAEKWAAEKFGEGGYRIEIRSTPEAMKIAQAANPKAEVFKFRNGR